MLHALPCEGLALIDVKSTEASTIQTTQLFSVVAIGKADVAATTCLVVVDRNCNLIPPNKFSDGKIGLGIPSMNSCRAFSIQILHWRVLFAADDRKLGQD